MAWATDGHLTLQVPTGHESQWEGPGQQHTHSSGAPARGLAPLAASPSVPAQADVPVLCTVGPWKVPSSHRRPQGTAPPEGELTKAGAQALLSSAHRRWGTQTSCKSPAALWTCSSGGPSSLGVQAATQASPASQPRPTEAVFHGPFGDKWHVKVTGGKEGQLRPLLARAVLPPPGLRLRGCCPPHPLPGASSLSWSLRGLSGQEAAPGAQAGLGQKLLAPQLCAPPHPAGRGRRTLGSRGEPSLELVTVSFV